MGEHDKKPIGKAGDNTISTPGITKLPDGSYCIGAGCANLTVNPKTSEIKYDARGCPDEVQNAIVDALRSGAMVDFKTGEKPKEKK